MDFNGNGVLIEQDRLYLAMNMRPDQFDMDKFRHICILSGCDYLPSLPGIGLAKARKFIEKNTDKDIHKALTRLASVLNIKSLVVTAEYRDAFVLADITFKHQLVFCPLQRKQVRLNPITADITEDQLRHAGTELNADIALQMALGNCDPSTRKMLHDFDPDKIERKRKRAETEQTSINQTSIWSRKYKLKAETHISGNTFNSSIKAERERESCIQKDSPNDQNSPLKHINSINQCDKFLEYPDLNTNAILDMYNSNQDVKATVSPQKRSEEYLYLTENNVSPELFKEKNPFVKRITDHTTSPSVLSNENCRKRGRNLMRIKRTIIDENIIVESKYFSKRNEKRDMLTSENSFEDRELRSTKCNLNLITDNDVCDGNTQQQEKSQDLKTSAIANANVSDNTPPFSDLNKYFTSSYGNVSEKAYSDNRITEMSPVQHFTTNNDNSISNNLFILSSDMKTMPDSANYENASNLRNDSSKWSSARSLSSHKKKSKERHSTNLALRVNSVTEKKQLHQNKHLTPISKQQSLLSMYGFQKRPTLKH